MYFTSKENKCKKSNDKKILKNCFKLVSPEEYNNFLFSNSGITKVNTRRDSEVCSNTHKLVTKAHIRMLCCNFRGPFLSTRSNYQPKLNLIQLT